MRRDLGDFQTPPELVDAVLDTLGPVGARWPRVLEPTCGRGNFLAGLLAHGSPPREIRAVEIQPSHCRAAETVVERHVDRRSDVSIIGADVFSLHLGRDLNWRDGGPLLVVGNPPWVTSAELGCLPGGFMPPKSNLKGLAGLDARTGSSNFDVAEAIWLKLARELASEGPTIAFLCKTSVARGILKFAHSTGLPVGDASIHRIDAARWFGATVEACFFRVTLAPRSLFQKAGPASVGWVQPTDVAPGDSVGCTHSTNADGETESLPGLGVPVYANLNDDEPTATLGFARGSLVADGEAYRRSAFADGTCPRTWRQGLKHDAAAVMELTVEPATGRLRNGMEEVLDVEPEYVYPLIKGSDLRRPPSERPRRAVLVTQTSVGDDTAGLESSAPRLWAYLLAHAGRFERRRSSVYRGRPPFAIFGVGPYTFATYKVAVSGLHKRPVFRALGPRDGRPAVLDDTCYFLPCSSATEAAALAALCNDPIALDLLASVSFRDAKRPITKALLQRLDFGAIAERAGRGPLRERAATAMAGELATGPSPEILDGVEQVFASFGRAGADGLGSAVLLV